MTTCRDDLLDLFDYVWHRFRERMAGVDDEELAWQPAPDERITLRWRIAHIAQALGEERNGPWLGLPAEPAGQQAAGCYGRRPAAPSRCTCSMS